MREGDANNDPELISLESVLAAMLEARWVVLFITALTTAGALWWTLSHGVYKSQGFFQFGGVIPYKEKYVPPPFENAKPAAPANEIVPNGIALADFKRFSAAYSSAERFANFVREKKLESAVGGETAHIFGGRDGIARWIEPVYAFSKLDAKELIEQKDNANNTIGLRINYEARTPEAAQRIVGVLGDYVRDSIIYSVYSDDLLARQNEAKGKISRVENVVIGYRQRIEEYRHKIAELKRIVVENRGINIDHPALPVSEDNVRYLPPAMQLAATQVQLLDADQMILRVRRDQMQKALWLEYFDRAKVLLDSTKSGETVLRGLESVKEAVFKNKDMNDDAVKEVYNAITIENQTAVPLYLDRSRFVAGPSVPGPSSAQPLRALGVGFLLGLFISLLLVLGRKWSGEVCARISRSRRAKAA